MKNHVNYCDPPPETGEFVFLGWGEGPLDELISFIGPQPSVTQKVPDLSCLKILYGDFIQIPSRGPQKRQSEI